MELSMGDRLILVNQYEILKRLDEDQVAKYDNAIAILKHGFKLFYPELDAIDKEVSEDDCVLVRNTLTIYHQIEKYKTEHPDDTEIRDHVYGRFVGFDGNNEGQLISLAEFLIYSDDLYLEQRGSKAEKDGFNNHTRMHDTYKRMITRWEAINCDLSSRKNILSVLGD